MKLVCLKLQARDGSGWESPILPFGEKTTSLYGPNGSGKTPVVQSIPFCLGFDVKFQNDVKENCHSATLTVEHEGQVYQISRDFGEFRIAVETASSRKEFFSETEFSTAIFQEFGLAIPTLISLKRLATQPFISSLLPIFYVRQIGGYDEPYKPPANFIQDQFVEMIRFAFTLGPKRSYSAQRDLLAARDQLDIAHRRVAYQQKIISDLATRIDDSSVTWDLLKQRSVQLNQDIFELRESNDARGAAEDALLQLLHEKEQRIRALRQQHGDLSTRISSISSIKAEILGEIETLSLNEESRRAFESFFDVCGRADCGLFVTSTATYAKNLTYLKDQLKDLTSNTDRAEIQLEFLAERIAEAEIERKSISEKLSTANESSGTRQVVAVAQTLTRELMTTEQALGSIEQLRQERNKFLQLETDRSRIQDKIANLTNNGRQDHEFNALRIRIQESTVKWMEIIGTPNASRQVEIDLDFKFRFGKQPIDVFNGSTRSRLILAIHAAIFELYLQKPDRPFRFLILDTPKQQELASSDLGRYLKALEVVCSKHNGQILVSSTEYRHPISGNDQEWRPGYKGPTQSMYLGKHDEWIGPSAE